MCGQRHHRPNTWDITHCAARTEWFHRRSEVTHPGQLLAIDEVVRVIRSVALKANAFRHAALERVAARVCHMARTGAVANLALNVSKRLLGIAHAIPIRRPKAHDVAGHAYGLVMAVCVEKSLVSVRVLG